MTASKQWYEIEYVTSSLPHIISSFGIALLTQAQADQLTYGSNGQVIDGPFKTKAIAQAHANADTRTLKKAEGNSPPASGSSPAPSGNPQQSWTFNQIIAWANSRSPGSGDQFIAWVKANNTVPPPYALNLNSDTFGPTGFGTNDTALDWFGAWLVYGNVGPGIAKILGNAITGVSTSIPKWIGTVATAASGPNPGSWTLGASNLSGWFVRGLKMLFGGILIILGISRLTGASNGITKLAGNVKVVPL